VVATLGASAIVEPAENVNYFNTERDQDLDPFGGRSREI
jgi:hypothetical protein